MADNGLQWGTLSNLKQDNAADDPNKKALKSVVSLIEQIKHYFWMQKKDLCMEVIVIAAVWQGAMVKRTEGTTPGYESIQGCNIL